MAAPRHLGRRDYKLTEIRLKPSTAVFPIGEWIFIAHQRGKCKVPIDMKDEVRDICRGISTEKLTHGHRILVRILKERGLLDEHITPPREISPRFERLISYLARFEPEQDRMSSFGKLQSTRVCVVGLGGLGTWMVQSLVMLGIRRLILIDGDAIEISNFNRQLFWREEDIGRAKVEVAVERLHQWDPSLEIESHFQYITSSEVVRQILLETGLNSIVCRSAIVVHSSLDQRGVHITKYSVCSSGGFEGWAAGCAGSNRMHRVSMDASKKRLPSVREGFKCLSINTAAGPRFTCIGANVDCGSCVLGYIQICDRSRVSAFHGCRACAF